MGEKMSKANSNFDHLGKDKYGDKEVKGTYYTIHELEERVVELEKLSHEPQNYREKCEEMEERIDKLEAVIDNFMNNWGLKCKRLGQDETPCGTRWSELSAYRRKIKTNDNLTKLIYCSLYLIMRNESVMILNNS